MKADLGLTRWGWISGSILTLYFWATGSAILMISRQFLTR